MSSALKQIPIPRLASLSHKSVLELTGPDAQKFLKGLSCKDVDSIGGGYSGFLNASGRVLHTSFIFPIPPHQQKGKNGNGYLITHESPSDHPAPLQTILPPFRLRAKVKIRDVTQEWDAYSAWGASGPGSGLEGNSGSSESHGQQPTRNWKFGSGGAAESQWSWENGLRDIGLGEEEVGCWDLRGGWGGSGMGRQILVPKGKRPSLSSSYDTSSTDDYHLRRLSLGIPEGPNEIVPASALPLESCMDLHGGVDFRKGCYLGQELTVRTYHTGATRKRILPIRLIPLDRGGTLNDYISPSSSLSSTSTSAENSSASEFGTELGSYEIIFHPPANSATKKTRSAGKILALRGTSNAGVGLGLVRLEMVEKCWWNTPSSGPLDAEHGAGPEGKLGEMSVQQWLDSGVGRLTTDIGDRTFGVYVDKGEAYRAALEALTELS